ncbi:unnamed protein product [Auanema sp. JU1783]|nr:unnamed protein product [Auanema sp. JU1783]
MYRVVVTGVGTVTPYGAGVQVLHQSLVKGISGLKYKESLGFLTGAIDDNSADFERWTAGQKREMSRASQLALLAAEEALTAANATSLDHTETLVNIGTGVADLEAIGETSALIQKGQARRVSPYFVPRILNNLPAGYVAMKYGMMGGADSSSTACATGLHAIGNAFRAVRHGWAKSALAGATESCVNAVALAGFDRMRALTRGSSTADSCPFDEKRSGFVLSEGVGLLFLERLEVAQARSAPILAELVGFGISSDCYHISSPHPSGIGAQLSMQRALTDATIASEDVSYVNAHATSTTTGDLIESKAVCDVFGKNRVPVSSFKGHFGHLLAAAGAVETIGTIANLRDEFLIPTLNVQEVDSNIQANIFTNGTRWNDDRKIAVVNSFGFGGTNASLVLKAFEQIS